MPVSICPRCKHVNPEYATYCHFDGVVLQAQQNADAHRLASEFVFPSGRRCNTFDDIAQGCQEEWMAARDLLMRGVFAQFFHGCRRDDLVRAANDARANPNPDIALTTFLNSLPGSRTQTPKLDLSPRRILLGNVPVGETRSVALTITNQGESMLQGTITVAEGQDWLSLSEAGKLYEMDVAAVREQVITLTIRTKGIAAGQAYGAKLTVVTNGGIVEIPLRMDLVAQPFPKAPFQGVRTQRELADKMRQHPKAAVPILESGEVKTWYALNGWTYPIQGAQFQGVAGVQQFFEGIGVSKPPPLSMAPPEIRITCKYKDRARAQALLETNVKKWVYANVRSDSPWLKALEPQVAGPQRATVPFEIDTNYWNQGQTGEGKLLLDANSGTKLTLKVIVTVPDAPLGRAPASQPSAIAAGEPPPRPRAAPEAVEPVPVVAASSVKFVPAFFTTLLLCLMLRVLLIPFVDFVGRTSVANAAAEKLGVKPGVTETTEMGGWLNLPWLPILSGSDEKFSAKVFQPESNVELKALDFRHYFVSYFIRWFVVCTFWIGSIVGPVLVVRRGGSVLDIPWGVIAGSVGGLAFSATLAAFFLAAELLPHALWHALLPGRHGIGFLFLWILLAMVAWFFVGVVLGLLLPWIGPLRRLLIDPFQWLIAGAARAVGFRSFAEYWTP